MSTAFYTKFFYILIFLVQTVKGRIGRFTVFSVSPERLYFLWAIGIFRPLNVCSEAKIHYVPTVEFWFCHDSDCRTHTDSLRKDSTGTVVAQSLPTRLSICAGLLSHMQGKPDQSIRCLTQLHHHWDYSLKVFPFETWKYLNHTGTDFYRDRSLPAFWIFSSPNRNRNPLLFLFRGFTSIPEFSDPSCQGMCILTVPFTPCSGTQTAVAEILYQSPPLFRILFLCHSVYPHLFYEGIFS